MPQTKVADLSTNQALAPIYNFFKKVSEICSHSTPAQIADVEGFFSKSFEFTNNGHLICRSAADYLPRLQKFQKKYSKFECSKPLEAPVTCGHQIAFQYKVDLTSRQGQHKQVYISTIATIEDNKITHWSQVAHEKGTGDWDT